MGSKALTVATLLAMSACCAVPFLDITNNGTNRTVEEFISHLISEVVMEKLSNCALVLAHDYRHLPSHFQQLLVNFSAEYKIALPVSVPATFLLPTGHYRDFWDLHSKYRLGPCALHMLTTETPEDLDRLHLFLAETVQVVIPMDHFILWSRTKSHEALSSKSLFNARLKIAVTSAPGSGLILRTICFFCRGGYHEEMTLGTYPGISAEYMFPVTDGICVKGAPNKTPYVYEMDWKTSANKVAKEGRLALGLAEATLYYIGLKLNASWSAYESAIDPKSLELGSRLQNGSWIGWSGELMLDRANFTLIAFYQANDMSHLLYSFPAVYGSFRFVTRFPNPMWSWKTIFWPYKFWVWVLVTTATLMATAITNALLTAEARLQDQHLPSDVLTWSFRICSTAFLEQLPQQEVPRLHGGRVFLLFWFYFAMVITCGYQEMVFAFLSIPAREVLPVTFEELVNSEFTMGAPFYMTVLFNMVANKMDIALYKDIQKKLAMMREFQDCMERSLADDFACIGVEPLMDFERAKMVDSRGHMKLRHKTESILNLFTGQSSLKDSITSPILCKYVMWVFNHGLLQHWHSNLKFMNMLHAVSSAKKRLSKEEEDEEDEGGGSDGNEEEFSPLTTRKLYGPMGLIVAGWIIALAFFFAEVLSGGCKGCHKHPQQVAQVQIVYPYLP